MNDEAILEGIERPKTSSKKENKTEHNKKHKKKHHKKKHKKRERQVTTDDSLLTDAMPVTEAASVATQRERDAYVKDMNAREEEGMMTRHLEKRTKHKKKHKKREREDTTDRTPKDAIPTTEVVAAAVAAQRGRDMYLGDIKARGEENMMTKHVEKRTKHKKKHKTREREDTTDRTPKDAIPTPEVAAAAVAAQRGRDMYIGDMKAREEEDMMARHLEKRTKHKKDHKNGVTEATDRTIKDAKQVTEVAAVTVAVAERKKDVYVEDMKAKEEEDMMTRHFEKSDPKEPPYSYTSGDLVMSQVEESNKNLKAPKQWIMDRCDGNSKYGEKRPPVRTCLPPPCVKW
jgi:hypothetical protein